MVLINDEKYACERCVRGHRVSGCRHVEARLKKIKPKGRPPALHSSLCNSGCGCNNDDEDSSSKFTSPFSGVRKETTSHVKPEIEDMAEPENGDSPMHTHIEPVGGSHQTNAILGDTIEPEELRWLVNNPCYRVKLPDGTVVGPPSPNSPEPQTESNLVSGTAPSVASGFSPAPPLSQGSVMTASNISVFQRSPSMVTKNVHQSSKKDDYNRAMNQLTGGLSQHLKMSSNPLSETLTTNGELLLNTAELGYSIPPGHLYDGPYNAELYNDPLGNNAAFAAINMSSENTYSPNTGTVHDQSRLTIDNELMASNKELTEILPCTKDMDASETLWSLSTGSDKADIYAPEDTHTAKLSSLY